MSGDSPSAPSSAGREPSGSLGSAAGAATAGRPCGPKGADREFHDVAEERADVLAYLARKAENARAIAARSADLREVAERDLRCIQVIAGDLQSRMHEGEAAMAREFGRALTPFGEEETTSAD